MCMDAFLNHIICHISTMCVVYDLMYLVSALFLEIFTFETKIFFFFFFLCRMLVALLFWYCTCDVASAGKIQFM